MCAVAALFATNVMAQVRTTDAIDYYNNLAYRCHDSGDMAGAAKNFLLYLEEPAKRGMTQAQQDSLYQADRRVYDQAAVNAMYLFYSVNDMDGVLAALPYGRRIDKGMTNVYVTALEAYKEKGMDAEWLALLKEAVMRCPQNSKFPDQLIEYYSANGNTKEAYAEMDKLIAADNQNADAWYLKGVLYFNVDHDIANARNCFSKALAITQLHAQACVGMASTYIADVTALRRKGMFKLVFSGADQQVHQAAYKKELAEVQPYYFNACRYLEASRTIAPEDYNLWSEPLLECYRILNMKEKYNVLIKEMEE